MTSAMHEWFDLICSLQRMIHVGSALLWDQRVLKQMTLDDKMVAVHPVYVALLRGLDLGEYAC